MLYIKFVIFFSYIRKQGPWLENAINFVALNFACTKYTMRNWINFESKTGFVAFFNLGIQITIYAFCCRFVFIKRKLCT